MNFRRELPLILSIILFAVGISLFVYGSGLPEDLTLHTSKINYSRTDTANSLQYLGALLLCVAIWPLLFWICSRAIEKKFGKDKSSNLKERKMIQ